jgi:hypothetical protein
VPGDGWPTGRAPVEIYSDASRFRNRLRLLPESYNRAGLGDRAVGGPRLHQPPPLVEQVAAPVGRLGRVLDHVSKASFANLIGEIGAFGCPIA